MSHNGLFRTQNQVRLAMFGMLANAKALLAATVQFSSTF